MKSATQLLVLVALTLAFFAGGRFSSPATATATPPFRAKGAPAPSPAPSEPRGSDLAADQAESTGPTRPQEMAGEIVAPTPRSAAEIAALYASNPMVRDRMSAIKRQRLEESHAGLVAQWDLAPADRQKFLDLLLEAQLADTDQGMKIMVAAPENRAQLVDALDEQKREIDLRLQSFLGPARYAEYSDDAASAPLHTQVRALAQRLVGTGEPLTPEQSASLYQVLASSRAVGAAPPPPAEVEATGRIDPESARILLQQMDADHATVAAQAASVLTPLQLAAFRQMQAERTASTKQGLGFLQQE